ncbi:class I SAM-dependent methyltransferase [Dehalobacter sp. DCM]|uniref:class I SAM-dependent methyltransferase n=1 Tax=Dehalobacter sp. DCM TaxID=2907827 RepID=UPI00308150B6|nr:class I SAM-dependent methyltransferase [Dehalobacter sp. DCM]
MEIQDIRNMWSLKEHNKQASVDMWNSMAGSFGDFVLPGFEEDSFLKLLKNKKMISPAGQVLDVGCGAGKYALAIAGSCGQVTGVDLSPQMIALAEQKKKEYKINNTAFYCEDWHELDLAQAGWEHQFDLVFAHMTPAVQSADTFEKLSAASKDWCVLAKPIRRTDPVSDAVKELIGIKTKRESSEEEVLYAFELLWRQGYLPGLEYEKQVWNMKKTWEQAEGLYLNRMKTYRELSPAEEDKVRDYLRSLLKDGFICEDVDTTIATIHWQVGQ